MSKYPFVYFLRDNKFSEIDAFFEEVEVNLIAKIKEENVRSVDLFKRCGFVFDRQEVGFNVFSYSAGDKK